MLRLPTENTLDKEKKMEHWNEAKIKDFAEVKGGKRLPKGKQLIKEPNSHPYIRIRDLGKTKYLQLNSEYEYVDDETHQSIARYIVNKGDILISVVGTIGLIGIVGETLDKANQTENCDKIINIKNVLPEYLYYYLISSFGQDEIRKGTVGAVQPKLPLKNVQDITIFYPSIEEQERIVNILSSVDEKIEMNNAINNNLEQQAEALFHSLFVGNANPTWKDGVLSDLGTIVAGGTPSKSKPEYYSEHGIAWITPKDLSLNKSKFISHGEIDISELGFSKSSATKMPAGTVLFSSRAPIGYIAIAANEVTTNQGFKSVVPNENIGTAFMYYLLKFLLPTIEGMASGSTFKEISGAGMKTVPVVIPDNMTIEKFNSFCTPIFQQQEVLESENSQLADIRDALLPKLMSGEIDVSNTDL